MAELVTERGRDLEAIRARAAAAVPGPWRWGGNTEVERVHLCTDHSGQRYILAPAIRQAEYVHDHFHSETYGLQEYRERLEQRWAEHDKLVDEALEEELGYLRDRSRLDDWQPPTRALDVLRYIAEVEDELEGWEPWEFDPTLHPDNGDSGDRERIRDFLAGSRDAEDGAVTLSIFRTSDHAWLTRGVQAFPDLQLPVHGWMRSYRDVARYEVLGGQTRAEAGLAPDAGRMNSPLYREDIVGLDTPEADFIAHARQDVDDLLAELDAVRAVAAATFAAIDAGDLADLEPLREVLGIERMGSPASGADA